MSSGFQLFGRDHLATLAVFLLVAVAAHLIARARGPARSRGLRFGAAFALAGAHLAEQTVAWWQGTYGLDTIPLQLCDISAVLAVYALLTLDRRAVEPLYFFALAGTLPAIVTPELNFGFPHFSCIVYFVEHGLTALAPILLVFSLRLGLRQGAWWRAFLQINLLALAVTPINLALRANFMYLMHKPEGPTPFDWFGPWPGYVLVLEAIVIVVFRSLALAAPQAQAAPPLDDAAQPMAAGFATDQIGHQG